jgi:uncharacterized protein YndB with AHSA1/START domain
VDSISAAYYNTHMTKKNVLISIIVVLTVLVLAVIISGKTSCTVVVERSFNGSPERVWSHWNNVESIKQWWSPKDYTAPVIQNDFRVDGTYLFSMKAPDGKIHWNVGRYKEIVPYSKIVSVMSFSDENGKAIPGSQVQAPGTWPDEIGITVEFNEIGGRTLIRVTENGIPSIMYLFAKMGWNQQFDKFEKLIN